MSVEGPGGFAELEARDLADVEPRVRKVMDEHGGEPAVGAGVELEVELPTATQDRLLIIRQHCADIDAEYGAAIGEMADLGLPRLDISRVLGLYYHLPRPLTVTNAEVAVAGLEQHPDAVGLEWDDHGHFRSRKCRECVDSTRKEYGELQPDDENALIYAGERFACDFCDIGHEVPA